jgi:predicted TIM-barrel fold metal-dependent hydrolase
MFASTIDAHVHVWTDDIQRYPRAAGERDYQPRRFTPEDLFRHTKPAGVQRVVLIQMSFYRFDNTYMLNCIREHIGGMFAGVGIVNSAGPDVDKQMRRLSQQGVRGFRITPGNSPQNWLDTEGMQSMWKTGAAEKLAMCPLIGPDALESVDRMCRRYPETPVVIDHFARIGSDGTIRDSDIAKLCGLAAHKNVHVKVSAFYALGQKRAPYTDLVPMIQRLVECYGPQRLMWASDSPFQVENEHRYQTSIALVREHLPFLSESDREWLLGKTAGAVFFSR